MTPQQARVVQAEADARAAHTRFTGTLTALQERLRPATLVREARRELAGAQSSARHAVGRVVIDEQQKLRIGGGAAVALLLIIPLFRWRRRRRVAKRAARIRGH